MRRSFLTTIAASAATSFFFCWAPTVVHAQDCAASLPALPEPVAAAKAEIIRLCQNNIDRWGDAEFQVLVDAQADILEAWYVDNRPDNEQELTQGSWLAIWYEDNFFSRGNFFFNTDRTNTYQVVFEDFYYNVARNLWLGGLGVTTNFLKGAYSIINPKTADNCGMPRLNVIDLEFVSNRLGFGWLSPTESLITIVGEVDSGVRGGGVSIPGPIGVTGELWNLFVDEDLRVSLGAAEGGASGSGLYVLIRDEFVTN